MFELETTNWAPVIIGILATVLITLVSSITRKFIDYKKAGVNITYEISGDWYSAEFDYKTEGQKKLRNTFLKVNIRRHWFGNVTIKSTKELPKTIKYVKKTGWVVKGKLRGSYLRGRWDTAVEDTQRFGSVFLQFIDNGLAVGYWVGISKVSRPVYGYWILKKLGDNNDETTEKELKKIANKILLTYGFTSFDVSYLVENIDKPNIPEESYRY